jgi:hypothetical protein
MKLKQAFKHANQIDKTLLPLMYPAELMPFFIRLMR